MRTRRAHGVGYEGAGKREIQKDARTAHPTDIIAFMNKQVVKIIKRADGESKTPSRKKQKPKKKRSIESTIQDWITESRENTDVGNRTRSSEFAAWNTEAVPAEVA